MHCNVTASGCRRQWSHHCCHPGKYKGGKQSTEFTGALSQGEVVGKRKQKVETGNIVIGEIKSFSFLCALTLLSERTGKFSIALKKIISAGNTAAG